MRPQSVMAALDSYLQRQTLGTVGAPDTNAETLLRDFIAGRVTPERAAAVPANVLAELEQRMSSAWMWTVLTGAGSGLVMGGASGALGIHTARRAADVNQDGKLDAAEKEKFEQYVGGWNCMFDPVVFMLALLLAGWMAYSWWSIPQLRALIDMIKLNQGAS